MVLSAIHHLGTFLLLAAAVLLLITSISAPVVNDFALLKVKLTNSSDFHRSQISFGSYGYCILNAAPANTQQDWCTGSHIGYNPAATINGIDQDNFSDATRDSVRALTRVMVLHPIACGLAWIAFFIALGSGIFGSVIAALLSALTFIVSVVVMACDFALFGIIKHHVNNNGNGAHAYYSVAIWTVMAATIALFIATFMVLLGCCARRRERRNARVVTKEGYANGTVPTRRRFWQRRRY
ncbi:SUR7/PalI family-domain-containing protein [Xylogone sp. PMI_703]|nr:SUR7/PalI family-domain-containing protein [Xylogone sp. PMI_703]